MRITAFFLLVLLCTSCSLLTYDIQQAPVKTDQAVVFDIDGTLTPKPIAIGTARKDAAEAVRMYAGKGYKIIYLSARTRLLQSGIPHWLKKNRFPEGSIHVPQTAEDAKEENRVNFKKSILDQYTDKKWRILAAYGDSTTDFEAYREAGICRNHVFALKGAGADSCKSGSYAKCLDSWSEHLEQIQRLIQ